MKIAIIGAGIYGITIANKIVNNNNSVDLYEQNNDILKAASGINQFRLHRGYHYPRSNETVSASLRSERLFVKEYLDSIITSAEHYYCIAKNHSFTSSQKYLDFCNENGLEYKLSSLDIINPQNIDLCLKVKESLIDPTKLKEICWSNLKQNGVHILLNTKANKNLLKDYDLIINCTYANLNHVLEDLCPLQKDYQYELCEKPVLKLGPSFKDKSIVIMDGPFMCVDPLGSTGLFLMGNVVHAIHQTNIGKYPIIDDKFKSLLNNGIIKDPPITNFELFKESAIDFLPEIKSAEHVGSMYTVRTVLPYLDATDARPTIVEKISNNIINIFSGKISNCVEAANDVAKIIENI